VRWLAQGCGGVVSKVVVIWRWLGLGHTALRGDERAGRTRWHGGARGVMAARRALVARGWRGCWASVGKGGAGCAGAVALARVSSGGASRQEHSGARLASYGGGGKD